MFCNTETSEKEATYWLVSELVVVVLVVGHGFKLTLSHSHSPSPNVQSPTVSGSISAWEPAVTFVFVEEMIAVTACPQVTTLAQSCHATVRRSSGKKKKRLNKKSVVFVFAGLKNHCTVV